MQPQILRDYQVAARDAVRVALRTTRRVLLVAPTGSGKTTIAADMINAATGRDHSILFIAHRKELIDQCSARLDEHGLDHGVIMAQHPRWRPWLNVQVASIQTLLRRRAKLPKADIVFVDEAHHARADSYHTVLDDLYPSAFVVGLTATPWRIDGRGLGDLFGSVVVASTPAELIRRGYLVPYDGFAFDKPDLSGVRKLGGDYNEADLSEVMGRRELLGNIVGQWKANAGGVRTVVFAVDVAHSQHLCERFREVGVAAEHVDAQTPKTEREAILARLASGATTVVCNVAVLTEGWDCPAVECIIMARPTQSLALHLQMAGRGLRPNEATGKKLCRIHDHAGNIITHGLPDAERDYSLTTDRKANKKASEEQATTLRTCEECFAIYRADLKGCPACGHVNKTKERKPQETDEAVAIPLSEIAKYDAKYKRPWVAERSARSFYDQLMQVVRDRGYKERWAAMRFKEKFGFFPRYSWRDDAIRNSGS